MDWYRTKVDTILVFLAKIRHNIIYLFFSSAVDQERQ